MYKATTYVGIHCSRSYIKAKVLILSFLTADNFFINQIVVQRRVVYQSACVQGAAMRERDATVLRTSPISDCLGATRHLPSLLFSFPISSDICEARRLLKTQSRDTNYTVGLTVVVDSQANERRSLPDARAALIFTAPAAHSTVWTGRAVE